MTMAAAASMAVAASSCQESPADTIAQVGNARLSLTEVHLHMPLGLFGEDSAAFVQQYVDQWKEEQLIYQEGLRNVSNLDLINNEVEEYRRRLVSESYLQQVIARRLPLVTDEECLAFYQQHSQDLKLQQTIVKAVSIKVPGSSQKLSSLRKWLGEVLAGKTDHIEELEQYCQQHAVAYDNFTGEWADLSRLTDALPVTVVEPSTFLALKVYEMKDDDYVYMAAVSDYRLAGEKQPLEYAMGEIREMLGQQHRQQTYRQLVEELRATLEK